MAKEGFEIKCKNCGTTNTVTDIRFLCSAGEFESNVTIVCEKCDNTEEFFS